MTCREFKHSAASLTLWEMSQGCSKSNDDKILSHADTCEACGAWLRKQRSLATSMRTLQAETAGLEAGPQVEQALLAAFRRNPAMSIASAPGGVGQRSAALLSNPADSFTPMAMRLSRFFEIGAYVAVAAAIVVGVFLGTQLLHPSKTMTTPPQTASAAASMMPVVQKPVAEPNESGKMPVTSTGQQPAVLHNRGQRPHSPVSNQTAVAAQPALAEASQTSSDDGYIALMFCDPLSCSSDSQVVRMELPAASQDAQPQIADVVVGYDGLVRAVRIVN
jgi:hypothetical protein